MNLAAQLKRTHTSSTKQQNTHSFFYHLIYRSKRTRNITLVCSNFLLELYSGPKKKNMYLSQCNNQRYRQPTHRLGLVESFSGHYLYRKNQRCRKHCYKSGMFRRQNYISPFSFLSSDLVFCFCWPVLCLFVCFLFLLLDIYLASLRQ